MEANASTPQADACRAAARLRWPGLLLGVSFGGFFDGIVLHQILQWHHLFSGLSRGRWGDLRIQLLADGVFHGLMYVMGAAALVMLLRRRRHLAWAGSRDVLLVMFFTGFAFWHLLDAVLSHWLLGIHRIRMDSNQPLLWDVGWLLIFGGLPWLWARRHARRTRSGPPPGGGTAAATLLVAMTALAGTLAARQPPDAPTVVLLLSARHAPALLSSLPTDARIMGTDASGTVWLLAGTQPPAQRGAWMMMSGGWWPADCASWTRL